MGIASVLDRVQLSNGVRLPYVEQGDPAGVPVVLLHGWPDSRRSYERVLPHLPASMRVIAPTQRGHGDADRPESGYRPHDFAADLAAFLDALGIERAVVAGHSLGSLVAQRFAIDYPERTLGMVLIGAFTTLAGNAVWEEFLLGTVAGLEDPIDPAFVREFQESTLAQPVPGAFVEAAVEESLKVPARVWREAGLAMLDVDFASELGKIAAPALIVWGGRDSSIPRSDQDRLMAGLADARLLVYEDAGHSVHWEEPERLAADLVAFVRRLAEGGGEVTA
jgi:non-heme chloroperoxidase